MSSPLLRLIDVSKRYESPTDAEAVPVLRDVSLEIGRGESVAIVGPSGSGKSTLLNLMGTLDRPSSGQVLLDGHELSRLDDIQLAAVRNREIGFIFQSHHLLPQCTVLENVLVPTLANKDAALRNSAVDRALINQPKLLLADEPTGALDRASAQNLANLLVQLNREEGVTLIVVTHALDLAKRMSRVLELRDGR